jgi:hypothetical protein
VILHGQFSGMGLPVNWIAADILRIENGRSSTGKRDQLAKKRVNLRNLLGSFPDWKRSAHSRKLRLIPETPNEPAGVNLVAEQTLTATTC